MYFLKLLGGVLGGSGGLVWGVWGAVWLEKPIDSMTRRLSPAPVFVLAPISASFGLNLPSFGGVRLEKSGSDLDLGRRGGRSGHRVVELLERKASE